MLTGWSDIDPDRIFSSLDLTGRPALIAAVSGGSDSLAMLLLLQRWLERHAPGTRLVAVTVDHGLRDGSRAEAGNVARLCAGRGIAHRIETWTAGKPATGLAAAARLARYQLLANAAAEEGADIIVTGHTADDQAETVMMRRERGVGRGLAGMAPATLFDGRVWIVRPLLGTRRERLRTFLREQGVVWIEDPTNLNARYERVRTRRNLEGASGENVEALLEVAARAAAERQAVGNRAAALIAAHGGRPMQGLVRLAPRFAEAADEEAALLAFRALLAVIGGVEHLPDAGHTLELLRRLCAGPSRATLARSVVDARKSGVFLYRERRGLPAGPVESGTIWDGRYEIVKSDGMQGAPAPLSVSGFALDTSFANKQVDPHSVLLGRPPLPRTEEVRPLSEVPRSIVGAVRATMPQLARPGLRALPILAPWRSFMPSFDLVLARAVARLIGAPEIPSPPFAGHNGKEG